MHLASVVGVEETVSHTVATVQNLTSTLNLVGALTRDHVVLFASSADVYGAHSHLYDRPMREDDCFVYEHGLVNRWVYPHVKALEENLIGNSPARSVILRVFNTYGPGMDYPAPKRVIPHFVERVLARRPLRLSGDGSPAPDVLPRRGHGARLRAGARLRMRRRARRGRRASTSAATSRSRSATSPSA